MAQKLTREMLRIHKEFVKKDMLLLSPEAVHLLKEVMDKGPPKFEDLKDLAKQIKKESGIEYELYVNL